MTTNVDLDEAAALCIEARAAKLRRRLARLEQSLNGMAGHRALGHYRRALRDMEWVLDETENMVPPDGCRLDK